MTDETEGPIGGERDPLDRMAEEFADRCRLGESPTIAEYEARFPDQAERVRKLLGAVAMMEQMRRGPRQSRFLPDRIGEFRVLRELGRGGMGVVYEAVQESLWRHVAVKAMHHAQVDPKRLERFRREAQAVAQLHHTNIVPIFGVGDHEGVPYYAMQYIKGKGLDALIESWRTDGSPRAVDRWRLAARFASEAAEALGYAHDQGVLHRDIKPANLLIDEHDAVWITDFGLAKMVGLEDLTASGDVIGTLRYLSPESLRGLSNGQSDVYSLGLTLYEMITLQAPYGDLTPSELLHRVGEGQPVRPRQVDPSIPLDLETIVLKATSRDLKDRYGSARDLAVDLKLFLEDRSILARRANWFERSWRWSRRNRTVAALSALATAILVLATVVGWVGYVSTTDALNRESIVRHRAEENVTFLNSLFENVFDKLTADDQLETEQEVPFGRPPVAATGQPGGPRPIDHRLDPPRKDREVGERGAGGSHQGRDGGRRPDGSTAGAPPFPPDEGMMMSGLSTRKGGPSDPLRQKSRARAQALLESVLTSYDRFAEKNKANARLQGEAAWVYYKMSTLNARLDRGEQADQAFDRTLTIFEELSGQDAIPADAFHKLFKVCSSINPWEVDPRKLGTIQRRLERMDLIVGRLLKVHPNDSGCLRARMQLLAKLGLVTYHMDHQDPRTYFDRAIELAGQRIGRHPEDALPHSDRSDVLEAYAVVLEDQREADKARELLEAALEDLEWVAADGLKSIPLASRMESLADDFERLGDKRRSDQIQERADQIDPRPPLPGRKKPDRPFGPQRPDAAPTTDEATSEFRRG